MLQSNVKNNIFVYIFHHPVEAKNVTIVEVPYRHWTLRMLKERFTRGQEIVCALNNKRCDDWDTQILPGAKVALVPAVGWEAVWWIIMEVVVPIAIGIGLSYLGGMIWGDVKQPKDQPVGQSFAWVPHTTQREGIPRPICYGTNMHYGNIVAKWTDVDENGDEILYMILDYGGGPVQGRGSNPIYFNGQPSSGFPGVSIQERLGTLNQTCMTGFEKNKLEYRPVAFEISQSGGPKIWTTPNKFFDDIEYTLGFPNGIWYYKKSGSGKATSVGVKVEISEHGYDSWTTLFDDNIATFQRHPLYKAYKVSEQGFNCVHGKRYKLRFSKTTSDSVDRYCSDLGLRAVREVIDVAFTRPGRALLGIIALATNRLSGHINVKWVADDKLVSVFNGTTWSLEFTRNRAWIYLSATSQPVISGDGGGNPWVIEKYEGLSPDNIDLAQIYEWAEFCSQQVSDGDGGTEDRIPCDIIVDFQTDVWSLIYELAQIGRMHPYWQGHILTGWVDKAVDTDEPIDLVTMNNTMARSWRSGWSGYGEMAGGIEVFYKDRLEGYERKPCPISNEGAGLCTRVVAIEGTGVTGKVFASRVGNHILERGRLIKNVNSVQMYKDALRYKLGQVVRLQSNVPDWGESYKAIISETDNTVELDRVVEVTAGNLVYVRSHDEENKKVRVLSYTVASAVNKVLTIAETWDVAPAKNNIVAIGKMGDIKLRRITKMIHTADNYFDVEFETYDSELFDSDDIPPVGFDASYAWPQPAGDLEKPITKWEVIDLINQMLPPQPNTEAPELANCSWTGDSVDTVTWAKRDGIEPISFWFRGVSYEITPDNTTSEFIYWDPEYTTVFRTTNDIMTALAPGHWLMCRNKEGVALPSNVVQTQHAGILQAGTITASLGQIAALCVGTLQIQNNAVTIPESAYTAAGWVRGTIQSLTITPTGAPLHISVSMVLKALNNFDDNWQRATRIYIERGVGAVPSSWDVIYDSNVIWLMAVGDMFYPVAMSAADEPASNTYTYRVRISATNAVYASNRTLLILECKK